jgi:hypothetical protein
VDRVNELDPARLRKLQRVGTLCGFAAGAWLGAAEAPTKLVTLGVSPVLISFMMVLGVFLARWSLPALVRGTATLKDDVRQAPHLLVWAALGGCLWAVANTRRSSRSRTSASPSRSPCGTRTACSASSGAPCSSTSCGTRGGRAGP